LQVLGLIQRSGINPARHGVRGDGNRADDRLSTRRLRSLQHTAQSWGRASRFDDFGTGYSSLSHVHQLPLDKIKIDRKFIGDMTKSAKAASVVKTVIDLCDNLGVVCVAEGVETKEQARLLESKGCSLAQGFYFGKPMPARDVLAAQQTGLARIRHAG
jgi:EAL domain-containing protein (putative c-di-GMP-specific phosphodiesterase class I)